MYGYNPHSSGRQTASQGGSQGGSQPIGHSSDPGHITYTQPTNFGAVPTSSEDTLGYSTQLYPPLVPQPNISYPTLCARCSASPRMVAHGRIYSDYCYSCSGLSQSPANQLMGNPSAATAPPSSTYGYDPSMQLPTGFVEGPGPSSYFGNAAPADPSGMLNPALASGLPGLPGPAYPIRPQVTSTATQIASERRRDPDTPRKYQCPYCPYAATKRHNLEGHINSHEGRKPYACQYCGQPFGRDSDRRRHERDNCGMNPQAS